ncbi:MAG TPA: hypothetical protein VMT38_05070 [Terracidiphilus sp.]|nr:hypothetical protein [Terracidiphilus sp.]
MRSWQARVLAASAVPVLFLLAGCGGSASGSSSNGTFSISPGSGTIDTNCTGCNATNGSGQPVETFSATLTSGGAATVNWSVSGGDANTGAGTITTTGQYTPPPYLTADSVKVTVTATIASGTGTGTKASASVTVTPGFLEPLSPENAALGANGTLTVSGYIAEAGGSTGINYAVSSTATGSSGGQGTVGSPTCSRNKQEFTHCSVTYTAPGTVSTGTTFIVGTVGTSNSKTSTQVLLNGAGISSNPSTHQAQLATPILMGSSGGNNNDYDTQGGQIVDCCGGTLGALIQNSGGTQYLLSCNHVFARSDQATAGEPIVQPGIIDDNCTPYGQGGATVTPVGVLSAWMPLSSASTNVDAAIAQVDSGAVNTSGAIMELGTPGAGGVLSAAPPGISSTNGQGESGSIGLAVAKSGRTTGLTCANIAAVNLTVQVSYFTNCDESTPYITKTFTNQISIEGNQFSDAGDSGSLVVDVANAEPVGLFFAGGEANGVSEGVASPAPTVLAELGAQQGTAYTFVGTTDHPVSCLNYGNSTASVAQGTALSAAQSTLADQAVSQARMLINPSAGILGVATGKSSDRAGEATVILYVDQNANVAVPQMINGVRTEVIPMTPQAFAAGVVPRTAVEASVLPPLTSAVLNQAIAAKEQVAQSLMKQNSAYFGVGVGQSLDNPKEASLVIFVDRTQVPASLPPTINGLRTRYVIMNRLHVTRSYLGGLVRQQSHCMAHAAQSGKSNDFDPLRTHTLRGLNLF